VPLSARRPRHDEGVRKPQSRATRVIRIVIALIALAMLGTAWRFAGDLDSGWRWLLAPATLAVIAGVGCLIANRERLAGVAMVVAALTAPTGFAAALNLVLLILAAPLLLVGTGRKRSRS